MMLQKSPDEAPETQIFKICRNLLFLSDEGTVTLSHSSVRDYLTLKLSRQVKQFLHTDKESTNNENTDEDVLRIARETSLQLANSRICTECLDVFLNSENWTKKRSNPLLTYACKFWPKHAAFCHDNCFRDEILPRIKSLFHVNNYDIFRGWVFVVDDESNQLRIWTDDFDSGLFSGEPDPLYYAVIVESPDIVQFCLDQGSSPTSRGGKYGFPLQTACYLGNMDMIPMMLSKGDINNVDNVYGTPLQASIAGKQKTVAVSLISTFGADMNVRGETFGTASQMALALNDIDLLTSLEAHGAKINDEYGRGQAWTTAWKSNHTKISTFSAIDSLKLGYMLRMSPRFSTQSVDSRLNLLSICVQVRSIVLARKSFGEFMQYPFVKLPNLQRSEYDTTLLKIFYERMREDDLNCMSFIQGGSKSVSPLRIYGIYLEPQSETY
ncbi:ankyrin repeat-containing protein [Penicillium malachiteum]|nr:ankyrin repeat-containing protein [Penicillium malachiteum]